MNEQSRLQRRRSRERDRQASRISEVLAEKGESPGSSAGASPEGGQHTQETAPQSSRANAGHDFGEMDMSAEEERPTSISAAQGTRALDAEKDFATFTSVDGKPPMLRDGMNLPAGAAIENVNVSSSQIVGLLQSLAIQGGGGFGSDADFSTNAGPQIDSAIASMLNPPSLSGTFTETRGVNCTWTWRVSFRMGEAVEITGGGTGNMARTYGGSGQISTSNSTATTDSASVTAGGKKGDGKENGSEASASGTAGTSTTRTQTTGTQQTTGGGGTATTGNVLKRYRAPVIVEAQTQGDLDVSGTDYINPFKWGMYAAEAADSIERKSGSLTVGTIEYYRSEGIAAPAAPAEPAARKGWVEHELGITERTEANFAKAASALTVNPAEMSRAGARPIAHEALGAARDERAAPRVSLIQGGQADAYCDAMSAAAFTTPIPGGGSDIFVHSGVDLASMRGQHTLQHELAHATQFEQGEGSALKGLGGDPSQRQDLERRADEFADRALARNGLQPA